MKSIENNAFLLLLHKRAETIGFISGLKDVSIIDSIH